MNSYDIGSCRQKLSDAIRKLEARLTDDSVRESGLKQPYNRETEQAIFHLTGLESEIQKMDLWRIRPLDPYQWVLEQHPLPESISEHKLYPQALNLWVLFLAAPLTQREKVRQLLG